MLQLSGGGGDANGLGLGLGLHHSPPKHASCTLTNCSHASPPNRMGPTFPRWPRGLWVGVCLLGLVAQSALAFLPPPPPPSPWPGHSRLPPRRASGQGDSSSSSDNKVQPLDWLEEVRRKNYEVRQLQDSQEGARLRDRLSRVSLEGGYRVARALKRSAGEQVHLMSVVAEIKRRTPTGGATPTEVAVISDVGLVARQVGPSQWVGMGTPMYTYAPHPPHPGPTTCSWQTVARTCSWSRPTSLATAAPWRT